LGSHFGGSATFQLAAGKASWKLALPMADDSFSPSGIEQAGVIDFFAHDTKKDELLLVMFEPRPWDGSELQLFQLQEKFNAYVSFLLDGELAEAHPELVGKTARIELRCAEMPGGRALDLLNAIHDQLALQEIPVEVIVADHSGPCGSGCTCH
jgi:Family of unknown function (DUF6572)